MDLVRLLSLTHKHTVRHRATEVRASVGVEGPFLFVCVRVEKALYVFMLGGVNEEATHLFLTVTN